jgi:hypothetical protein
LKEKVDRRKEVAIAATLTMTAVFGYALMYSFGLVK